MTLLSQNVLILERHTSRLCHPRFVSFAPEDSCCFVVSCLFLFISTGRRGGESWDDEKEGYQHTHPTHTRTRHSRDVLHLLWPLARKAHLHKRLIYYRHTHTHSYTHTHTLTYVNCISSLSMFISLLFLFVSCFAVLILPVRRPYIHKLVEKTEKFNATVLLSFLLFKDSQERKTGILKFTMYQYIRTCMHFCTNYSCFHKNGEDWLSLWSASETIAYQQVVLERATSL